VKLRRRVRILLAVHQLYGATMSVSAIENHQSEITNPLTLSAKGERGQSQGFNPNPELNKETLSTVLLPLGGEGGRRPDERRS
jgi:hypothetical protein